MNGADSCTHAFEGVVFSLISVVWSRMVFSTLVKTYAHIHISIERWWNFSLAGSAAVSA